MGVEDIKQGVNETNEKIGAAVDHLIDAAAFLAEMGEALAPLRETSVHDASQAIGLYQEAKGNIEGLEHHVRKGPPLLNGYVARISKESAAPSPPDTSNYTRTQIDPVNPNDIRDKDTPKPRGSGRRGNRSASD